MKPLLAITLLFPGLASAHIPATYFLYPGSDWCAELQAGLTGDLYVFFPGDYDGPCVVAGPVADQYGERLYLQAWSVSAPGSDPSVLHHDGAAAFVLQIEGFDVSIENLEFADIPVGVDGIRLQGEGHVVNAIRGRNIAGQMVRQTGDLAAVEVRESTLEMVGNTAISLGCTGCSSVGSFVHDNLITGFHTGVLGTHGASAVIRDNVMGSGRTGMIWDGSASVETVIEENFVNASDDGLRLVGGSVLARNNVVTAGTALASIGPGAHRIFGNSLHSPAADALRLDAWADGAGLDFRDNAVTGPLPAGASAVVEGNVSCAEAVCDCWIDPVGWDFYPVVGGPLDGAGVALDFGDLLADWCGDPRPSVPTVGAFEAVSAVGPGPMRLDLRSDFDCDFAAASPSGPCSEPGTGTGTGTGLGTGTGALADSGPDGKGPARKPGCGCESGSAPAVGLLLLLPLIASRRRRVFCYTGPQ